MVFCRALYFYLTLPTEGNSVFRNTQTLYYYANQGNEWRELLRNRTRTGQLQYCRRQLRHSIFLGTQRWQCPRRLYHNHYTEEFAEHDVERSKWLDRDGHERQGEYWSKAQIEEATKNLVFPAGTTPCDRYVAFNMFHHDTCKVLSDEQIIKAAHEFFFCDKDAPEGKVWIYVCAMNK